MVADPSYRVTGVLDPDSAGDYLPHVMLHGKRSYRREDGAWFIWYEANAWYITVDLDVFAGPCWWKALGDTPVGVHAPIEPATGDATVAEI